ncbi:ABC transporter substrate-binding protein [Ramlibacter montanisoli]|uniref:ABC transporter substrate-binding protein n=1 Tax=Ramlibacter montanisoli TaxID=2732512 RepID=A0A849K7E5_9BURK|nr:ABC transporter substrate-binding protein [Ramlibacter montanisoli]NNU42334.1 ABC transporter substrate-binding protein [Ramlibacter montanisoli]
MRAALLSGLRCAAAVLAASLLAWAQPLHAGPTLTAEQQAGRRLYLEGESAFGDAFTGRIGMGQQQLPGPAVRCGNCHGADGRGRPEGGIRPVNITWSELTKSYGHAHDNGRRHPPFDEASLRRAIVDGVDAAGNPLDASMPRFRISGRDWKALLAYMKVLELQQDPGVGSDTLRLGTLLPGAGRFAELGQAVKGILQAHLDEINAGGGIHGRRLELVSADYASDDPDAARSALRKLVAQGDVFALLSPFAAGLEDELGRLANESRIPVVGPLSLFGADPRSSNQQVFHLLSGIGELAEVLALHLGREPKARAMPAVLLHPDGPAGAALADALGQRLKNQGWSRLDRVAFRPGTTDAAALARTLKARGAEAVFLLGPGVDVAALARQLAEAGRPPYLLLPGPLAPRAVLELPAAFDGRILLAYPTVPADQKPEALRQYAALFKGSALVRGHQTTQVPAYSSAVLLAETLKRVGRDLTREKLVAALESVQGFEPGLVPAVSFNASRRVGALGGYVVAVDLKARNFSQVGGFLALP